VRQTLEDKIMEYCITCSPPCQDSMYIPTADSVGFCIYPKTMRGTHIYYIHMCMIQSSVFVTYWNVEQANRTDWLYVCWVGL